jgi:toxin-antitoxin system PIN domain toxin
LIAVDTNILIYAHRRDSEWHEPAAEAVRSLAEGRAAWGIPWPCIHEFLAIVTHPRIYQPPSSISEALRQVDHWIESPSLQLLGELNEHWAEIRAIVEHGKVHGPAIHDARIAALCREHGVTELWTADRDFTRMGFPKTKNPLLPSSRGPR